jgi:RNA polymerase sigma-70 factor (ECF subfamily)
MTVPTFAHDLAAAQHGDEAAFEVLWRAVNPGLVRYLRVVARAAAEDIAAETWLQIIRSLPRFRGDEGPFRAWVFTIARNKVIDWHRYESGRPTQDLQPEHLDIAGTDDTELAVLEQLSTERALALIAALPPDMAEIVTLRVVAGLDVAQVAKLVHKRPGAVRVSSHRALAKLHALLGAATEHPASQSASRSPSQSASRYGGL